MYTYFRVCMRVYTRASFYRFARAVLYPCVVCVYVHAHARGSSHMYVEHVQYVYTTEDATSRKCACMCAYVHHIPTDACSVSLRVCMRICGSSRPL